MVNLRFFLVIAALAFSGSNSLAQTCGAPGKDGPATVTGAVNTHYEPATNATFNPSSSSIGLSNRIGSATPVSPGDLVLVIQMQCETINTTNTNNYGAGNGTGRGYIDPVGSCAAGQYEYVRAGPASGNTNLDLSTTPLVNTYISDAATATNRRTFQIVRVPQYSSASLAGIVTAAAWNGSAGGIVVMDVAGNLNLNNAVIDVSGKGFRGGGGAVWSGASTADANFVMATNLTDNIGAIKGEGIAGTPRLIYDSATDTVVDLGAIWGGYANGDQSRGAPGNAGGGGQNLNGNRDNGGGGGGANGGIGGFGGYGWNNSDWAGTFTVADFDLRGIGGASFAQATTNRLVMGGGGGAGGNNNSPAITSSGGAGGGIVLIRTGSTSGNGTINAVGAAGRIQPNNDSGGGGGAGGSVVFVSASGAVGGLTVNAGGGAGGDGYVGGTPAHAGGGGGGGGIVATSGAATINTAGASNGVTNAGGNPVNGTAHGATPGANGSGTTSVVGQPTGVAGGAACAPQLTVTKSTSTPLISVPSGTTAAYRITVSNASTAGAAYGVSLTDVLPPPFTLQSANAVATTTLAGTGTSGPGPTTANTSGNQLIAIFGAAGTGNNPTTPSFTIFPGGAVTLTFVVNLNTATPGTFQNSATVAFTDPTRTTGGAATGNATAVNPSVSPGGTYAAGGTVGGSNYSSASSTAEDVRLQGTALITVSKSNGANGLTAGQTTTYTIVVGNQGPSAAAGTTLVDPATPGLNCTVVTCSSSAANMCPASPTIAALQGAGVQVGPSFPSGSTATFLVACGVTATGQ